MKRNGKKILFLISMIVLVALVHAQYYDENYYSTRDYNNGYYAGYNSDIYRSYQPPTNNLNENTNQNQPAYQNQYYSGLSLIHI